MMTLLALTFAGALFQQQPRPSTVPSAAQVQAGVPAPRTAFDTTVAAMTDVGTKVAEVRTAYELYRRAVYNEPDGAIVQRASAYAGKCRALATAALQAQQRITAHSVAAQTRTVVMRYREYLPSLSRVGQGCANKTQQLRTHAANEHAAALAMRNDIQNQGNHLLQGLAPYEARLHDVRVAMGWEQSTPARRPAR